MNPKCENELTGRQSRFCSDKCRMTVTRTNKANKDGSGSLKPEQPEHEHPPKSEVEQKSDNQLIADLPRVETVPEPVSNPTSDIKQPDISKLKPGVSKPTGLRTVGTKDMTTQELMSGVRSYKGQDWINSPEYAEAIYRLLNWTVEELETMGQTVPSWKAA